MDEKLSEQLGSLSSTASKESILTLAKWMCFNRRQAENFAGVLIKEFRENSNIQRKLLYLNVVHEVLIAESSPITNKWKRLAEFRKIIGEKVIKHAVSEVKKGGTDYEDKISKMIDQWEALDAFGIPNLTSDLRIILSSVDHNIDIQLDINESSNTTPLSKESNTLSTTLTDIKSQADNSTVQTEPDVNKAENVTDNKNTNSNDVVMTDKPSPLNTEDESNNKNLERTTDVNADSALKKEVKPKKQDTVSSPKSGTKEFDFESEGIEFGKVSTRDFMEPCKSIATMQITREIRNDTVARLWTTLQTIPKEIEEYSTSLVAQNKKPRISTEEDDEDHSKGDDDAILEEIEMSDDVLDLDIAVALSEVKQFREVVQRQHEARKKCINLLIKSRCQFGSHEAAELFTEMGEKLKDCKKRKLLLSDAMELEGLDFEGGEGEEEGENGQDDEELESFPWYKAGTKLSF